MTRFAQLRLEQAVDTLAYYLDAESGDKRTEVEEAIHGIFEAAVYEAKNQLKEEEAAA